MKLPGSLRHGFTLQALGAGLAAWLLLWLLGLSPKLSLMLGWSTHVLTHAALLLHHLGAAPPETMRRRARDMIEGRRTVTTLTVLAAGASLLFLMLQWQGLRGIVTAFAVLAIILSWVHVHLLFAQDYAHEYWMREEGLVFPGGDGTPLFSEFLYFAFTIGMTFQVSDVTTNTPAMRRLALLHALVSFAFNAVILAATVNIVAGRSG